MSQNQWRPNQHTHQTTRELIVKSFYIIFVEIEHTADRPIFVSHSSLFLIVHLQVNIAICNKYRYTSIGFICPLCPYLDESLKKRI